MSLLVLLMLVLVPFSAFAADQESFQIQKFISGRSIPPAPNMVIRSANENSGLEQVTEPPALKSGEILLRRGFGNNEYGLYKGLLAVEAYSRLSVFESPKGMKPSDFISCKLYENEVVNPDQDIHSIYFDNDYIYAENTAKIYYHSSDTGTTWGKEWNVLEMMTEKPWRLSITTEPQGAEVFIDGNIVGKTPFISNMLTVPLVRMKISAESYYSVEVMVQRDGSKIVEKEFKLDRQVAIVDVVKPDEFTIDSTQSVQDILNIIDKLKQQFVQVKKDGMEKMSAFLKSYPPSPAKDPFEKSSEFNARELEYRKVKEQKTQDLSNSIKKNLENINNAIEMAQAYRNVLEKRIYTKTFSLDYINISNPAEYYDPDNELWNVNLSVSQPPFNFTCKGSMQVPPEIARTIYQSGGRGSYLVLRYQDRTVKIDSVAYYYSFTNLSLVYEETEYTFLGEIKIDEKISSSAEYKAEMNRIAVADVKEKERLAIELKKQKEEEEKLERLRRIEEEKRLAAKAAIENELLRQEKKERQRKNFKNFRRVSCLSAGIICGSIGVAKHKQFSDARRYYGELGKGTGTAEFDAAWDNVEKNRKSRNALAVMSVLFLSGFAISIPF